MTVWAQAFLRACAYPATVYGFQFLAMVFFDAYMRFPLFDVWMHTLGGAAVACGVWHLLTVAEKTGVVSLRLPLLRVVVVVALTLCVAVVWEWYEFVVAFLTQVTFQGTVADTMADLGLGTLGALGAAFGFILYTRGKEKTPKNP